MDTRTYSVVLASFREKTIKTMRVLVRTVCAVWYNYCTIPVCQCLDRMKITDITDSRIRHRYIYLTNSFECFAIRRLTSLIFFRLVAGRPDRRVRHLFFLSLHEK
jgi:hypothetical protein